LRRGLTGDLDNIVLLALRKEPERRYPSASALADDIQRHLDGLPVLARPDTFGYRTQKFVRRNAAGVAAAAMAFLALGAVTAVTLVQSRRVAVESARVMRERDKAVEVRGFLMEMFGATGADAAVGDTVTVRRLLDLQAKQVESAYDDRPELKAEMMYVLADGYDRLGLFREAEPWARRALDLRRRALGARHPEVSSALNLTGWIVHELGKPKDAEPYLKEAIAIGLAADSSYHVDVSRARNDLGVVYNALGRYTEAQEVLGAALTSRRASLGDRHRAVGITANNLAAAYYFQARLDSAIPVQELALRSLQASVGADHQRTIVALGNLAAFKGAKGNWPEAEKDYRELLARQTRLQGADHPVTATVLSSLAATVAQRGLLARSDSTVAVADSLYRQALAINERKLGPTHLQTGRVLDRLAGLLTSQNRQREALELQQRALAIFRVSLGPTNSGTLAATTRTALITWRLGDGREAVRLQREVVTGFTGSLGASNPETARAQLTLCDLLLATKNDPREAQRLCAASERTFAAAAEGYRRNLPLARLRLAQAYITLGDAKAADSLLAMVRSDLASARPGDQHRILDSLTAALSARGHEPAKR
jgi:serine/threonine-protein kinase